jgi:hypothetical protein
MIICVVYLSIYSLFLSFVVCLAIKYLMYLLIFNYLFGRSQWRCGLRRGSWPVGCWDRGFESCLSHGCLSLVFLCSVLLCR